MRTRLFVGLLALLASGYVAAQSAPAAPSTAETPTGQQSPTERQPTDAPAGDSQAAGSQSSPATAADAPIAAPTGTQGQPTTPPSVTTSPDTNAPAMPTSAVAETGPVHPGDVAAGEQKAAPCGACHGLDGNSTDPQYPKIAGQNERYIARQLALYKTGERQNPVMQAMAAPLSPQDMRDLGAFFATKEAVAGLASDGAVAEGAEETWVALGAKLYRGGDSTDGTPACMSCHGPSGRGNPGARYPALAGQHANYTKAQLLAFRAGEVRGQAENANLVMTQVAQKLSDQDIEALSTYIEGLHRRPLEGMPRGGAPSTALAKAPSPAAGAAAPAAAAPAAPASGEAQQTAPDSQPSPNAAQPAEAQTKPSDGSPQ